MMWWKIVSVAATFCILWSVGPSVAAETMQGDLAKELQKFQGTWVMISGEVGGKGAADEHVKQAKIIIDGTKMQVIVPNQTGETIVAEVVKIDPTKSPKEMHFVRKNGPSAGKTLIGIYRFDGEDGYTFAFDPTGSAKLKDFVTKDGTSHVRNSWKRLKP